MQEQNYNVVGVMSGTSLDGVDLAHIRLAHSGSRWRYQLLDCETVAYDDLWVDQLRSAVTFSPNQLHQLNKNYTKLLGGIIRDFIDRHKISGLDAVCSHGHTILHRPADGITLQIGNLPDIAAITGQKVVCDFRVQDVLMGGQGAPLVPIGDRLLFAEYRYCLNLGGFSNISYESDGDRLAFDISPVNTVLNHFARLMGFGYDDRGMLAGSGNLNQRLLDELNSLDFYRRKPPKSLGFEFVREIVLPLINRRNLAHQEVLRTFCEHIALQISLALPEQKGRMLLTGGGAYHDFLTGRMRELMPEVSIEIPDAKTLEFKEALIFGLLGVLRLRGEDNVLASVTGAAKNHCAGKIFNPAI